MHLLACLTSQMKQSYSQPLHQNLILLCRNVLAFCLLFCVNGIFCNCRILLAHLGCNQHFSSQTEHAVEKPRFLSLGVRGFAHLPHGHGLDPLANTRLLVRVVRNFGIFD